MKKQQKGYTFVELIVVLTVLIILAGVGGTAALKNQFNEKRAGVTVRELMTLIDASSAYLEIEGEWPEESDGCDDLLDVLNTEGYIAGIDASSPWGTNYGAVCDPSDPKTLTLSVTALSNDWARFMANSLPAAQILADNRTVTTTLSRSLLLSALADKLVRFATIASNFNDEVDKPDCPAGYDPKIYGAFSGMSQSFEAPPIGGAYIRVISETSDRWTIRGEFTTTEGTSMPTGIFDGDRAQMMVITMCGEP